MGRSYIKQVYRTVTQGGDLVQAGGGSSMYCPKQWPLL